MKTRNLTIAGSILIALAHASALAQQPVIASFQGNGQLTWTNAPGTNCFSIQWAPSVTGPWSSTYRSFLGTVTTNTYTTISAPMFYRVAQGFTATAMLGTWMSVNPTTFDNIFFIAQSDGIISESAMFVESSPHGYYELAPSGRVTNTFVDAENLFVMPGAFVSADQIASDPPYADYTLRRVTDVARCAGNWSGTLTQTNGPGMPASYPVTFSVDNRGLVAAFSGFTGNGIGRMFALTNGPAIGFFYVGKEKDNGVYWEIKVSGTLAGNTFSGVYFTDSGSGLDAVLGTALLTRP